MAAAVGQSSSDISVVPKDIATADQMYRIKTEDYASAEVILSELIKQTKEKGNFKPDERY